MTTTAVQETNDTTETPAPDAAATRQVTMGEVFALAEDGPDVFQELLDGRLLVSHDSRSIDELIVESERSKLLAIADRLLKRLAGDEAEVSDITAAAKAEVELVTARYQAVAQRVTKKASWKRFCLEQLAAILFPDAHAKTKSVNLPYGTLGRKDYKPAPELVDEVAAIARCFADDSRELVKLGISTTAQELEDLLVNVVRRCESGGVHEKAGLTLTQAVRGEIDKLIACGTDPASALAGAPRVKVSLAWSELKKQPAVQLWTLPKGGAAGGVKMTEGSTVFMVEVTEG